MSAFYALPKALFYHFTGSVHGNRHLVFFLPHWSLDPLSPIIATEAIEHHRRALAMDPNFIEARFNLGLLYEQKEMFSEAISEFRRAIRISGGAALWWAALGHALALAGRKSQARQIRKKMRNWVDDKVTFHHLTWRGYVWVLETLMRLSSGWNGPWRSALVPSCTRMLSLGWMRCGRIHVFKTY